MEVLNCMCWGVGKRQGRGARAGESPEEALASPQVCVVECERPTGSQVGLFRAAWFGRGLPPLKAFPPAAGALWGWNCRLGSRGGDFVAGGQGRSQLTGWLCLSRQVCMNRTCVGLLADQGACHPQRDCNGNGVSAELGMAG